MLPSLRYRLARTGHSWSLFPLPEPERTAAPESLRRTLAEGGFRLKGVELEVVSP